MSNNKNFTILERKENTKEKINLQVFNQDFENIKKLWDSNLLEIKKKFDITDLLLSGNVTDVEKNASEDIWRAQVVFLASSFDYLLHELLKFSMLKIYNKEFKSTKKYNNFKVTMEVVVKLLTSPEDTSPLKDSINKHFGSLSFINKDKFQEVLDYIGIDKKELANKYYSNEEDCNLANLCNLIDEIFKRRHLIVHQSDRENGGENKQIITKELAKKYIDVMEKIATLIINAIQEKVNT